MNRFIFWCLLFFTTICLVNAENDDYGVLNLTLEKGLSSRYIRRIIMDHKGFLWIAHENGVDRFDSKTIKHYIPGDTLANSVHDIYEDSNDNLWLATHNGLHLYDREHDQFIPFMPAEHDTLSLPNKMITALYEDANGYLWIGHWGGFSRINLPVDSIKPANADRIKFNRYHYNDDAYINDILLDDKGNILASDMLGKIYIYDKKNNKTTSYPLDSIFFKCFNLGMSPEGDIYLSGWETPLAKIKYKNGDLKIEVIQWKEEKLQGGRYNEVNDIYFTEDHKIWLATEAAMLEYDPKSRSCQYN